MDMRIVEKFIERNISLIDDYNFKELYEKALRAEFGLDCELIGKLSEMLLLSDINPLLYVEKVPEFFLYRSTRIDSIEIPDNCKLIGREAFEQSKLKKIYLPKTIHTIDAGAFANCKDLNNIYIDDLAKFGSIRFIGRYSNPLDQGFFIPNLIVDGINLRERGFNIDLSYDFSIASNYGNYNMSISQNYPTEAILYYDKANDQDYAYYKDWRVDDLINNYYSNNIKTVEVNENDC